MLKTTIPLVDLRGKTPVDLLRTYPDSARALIMAAKGSYGIWSRVASSLLLPLADKQSHEWLKRTNNPFLHEIESFDSVLGIRGTFALNLSYEWGCTSGAYRGIETVSMMRVLDWPFPKLGKNVLVVLQSGKAGDFYNVTWSGISGVFNALAPSRFCAALNLAPKRDHGGNIVSDWIKNRKIARSQSGIPPSHLLRQVFEIAPDYNVAKEMLMKTPLAVPAIFTLTGINEGEGCVIERLENSAEVRELNAAQQVVTSNHFHTSLAEGTIPRPLFNSDGRYRQALAMQGHELLQDGFAWLRAPILNPYTRLCMVADAATGRLIVQGFEGITTATEIFNLPLSPNAIANAKTQFA